MMFDLGMLQAMVKARTETDLLDAAPEAAFADAAEFASLVQSAIGDIGDASLQAAARALFPLPYEQPAAPLTERRRDAGQCFFVSPSTFRTPGTTSASREDQVLEALAEALSARCRPVSTAPTSPAPTRRSRRRLALASMLVLPVASGLVLSRCDGDRSAIVTAREASPQDQPREGTVGTDGDGVPDSTKRNRSTDAAVEEIPPSVATRPVAVFQPGRRPGINLAPRANEPAELPRPVPPFQGRPLPKRPATTSSPEATTGTPTTGTRTTGTPTTGTGTTDSTTTTSTTTSSTSPSTTAAVAEPGLACPGVELTVDQARHRRVVVVLTSLGRSTDACQNTNPQAFVDLTFVDYLVTGDPAPWVAIGFADGRSLVVPQSAWRTYRSAVEKLGEAADARPTRWTMADDGRSTMETSTGLIVTGERTDIKHHYLTPSFFSTWRANRERLGQPMGHDHPDEPSGDDFERGYISIVDGKPVVTTVSQQEARAMLPADGELADSIVRQLDGTSWYVDAQLRRWWIPDGGVWGCLGGQDNVSADDVHGAAVTSLSLAGRAGCGLR